jgi:hypothetical protein
VTTLPAAALLLRGVVDAGGSLRALVFVPGGGPPGAWGVALDDALPDEPLDSSGLAWICLGLNAVLPAGPKHFVAIAIFCIIVNTLFATRVGIAYTLGGAPLLCVSKVVGEP